MCFSFPPIIGGTAGTVTVQDFGNNIIISMNNLQFMEIICALQVPPIIGGTVGKSYSSGFWPNLLNVRIVRSISLGQNMNILAKSLRIVRTP